MRQNSSIQFHVLTATWVGSGCLPRLYCQWSGREFQELRGKGVKVKEWWFQSRCKQLMAELHPGVEFEM